MRWSIRPILLSTRFVVFAAIAGSVLAHVVMIGSLAWSGRGATGPKVDVDSAPTQLVLADLPPDTKPNPTPAPKPEVKRAPVPEPLPEPEPVAAADVTLEPAPVAPAPAVVVEQPAAAPAPAVQLEPAPTRVPQVQKSPPVTPSFAGVSGVRASRIIYILDASGPMTSSLPWVKDQLLASVAALGDGQTFRVLVCRRKGDSSPTLEWNAGGDPEAFTPGGTAAVAPLNTWLETLRPQFATDTPFALRAAFSQTPDLVFVLTRSIRRSNTTALATDAILADLDRANPATSGERTTTVRILQFVDEDPTGLLRAIAAAHGDGVGSYRVMTEDRIVKTPSP